MAGRGLRVHRRGAAAAFVVHPGMGLGGRVRRGAHRGRVAADLNLQEVNVLKEMKVRMVCIRVPRALRGVVRLIAKKRG